MKPGFGTRHGLAQVLSVSWLHTWARTRVQTHTHIRTCSSMHTHKITHKITDKITRTLIHAHVRMRVRTTSLTKPHTCAPICIYHVHMHVHIGGHPAAASSRPDAVRTTAGGGLHRYTLHHNRVHFSGHGSMRGSVCAALPGQEQTSVTPRLCCADCPSVGQPLSPNTFLRKNDFPPHHSLRGGLIDYEVHARAQASLLIART